MNMGKFLKTVLTCSLTRSYLGKFSRSNDGFEITVYASLHAGYKRKFLWPDYSYLKQNSFLKPCQLVWRGFSTVVSSWERCESDDEPNRKTSG